MDVVTDTHRCARGRQCGDPVRVDHGPDQPAATLRPHSLCGHCERHAARVLRELPATYVQLETIIGEHTSSSEHVTATREPPIPPRVDVLVLQAELDVTLTTWARPVAARMQLDWDHRHTPHMRAGYRVHRAAGILAANLDALLRLVDTPVIGWRPGAGLVHARQRGVDGMLTLITLHRRAHHLVTGGTGDARLPVPCPSCEAPALVRLNGADQVDCRSCGRCWPESDYRRLCLILAEDYQRRPA